jgi:hypothetical protein
MIFIGMRYYKFTPSSLHLPARSGKKPYPDVKIATGCERLDAYSMPGQRRGLFKMLLSIRKRGILDH